MSRTEIYRIDNDGTVGRYAELPNAWRGAYLVWLNMARRYLNYGPEEQLPLGNKEGMRQIWDLQKAPNIPESHRIVMGMTFDRVVVRREELHRLIAALACFQYTFLDTGTMRDHADLLIKLADDPTCMGVCWNQTSVCANPWAIYHEDDAEEDYNIWYHQNHWYLFDELEKVKEARP